MLVLPSVRVRPIKQVSNYQEDNGAAMEELLNFILLASGAPATDGPYQPPEVCNVLRKRERGREGGREIEKDKAPLL